LFEDLRDDRFLAFLAVSDELDLDAVVRRDLLGVAPDLVAKRLGELREVEQVHPVRAQIRRHPLGVADLWDATVDDHAVVARENSENLTSVAQHDVGHAPRNCSLLRLSTFRRLPPGIRSRRRAGTGPDLRVTPTATG
jgi:hypothetical protein